MGIDVFRVDGSVLLHDETADTVKTAVIKHVAAMRNAGKIAYLQNANLQNAYLQNANLQDANLRGAYLQNAYLQDADLRGAYLQNADLQNADLRGAYMQNAYMQNANLQNVYLQDVNLQNANLQNAYLQNAYLQNAYLRGAELRGADLRGAGLPTGERWEVYLSDVVPALIAAGGHPVSVEAWTCHEWSNCPMAEAFGADAIGSIPLLYRPRVEQFIQLFDAGLIPAPTS